MYYSEFHLFLFTFLNETTRELCITRVRVVHIAFLLESAALEFSFALSGQFRVCQRLLEGFALKD